jgi:serine/threonine protein kinase
MTWHVIDMRWLADGGFATILVGRRSDTGAQVIVKRLRDKTPENRRYFSNEAKILRRRIHPRMAEILGGDPDGPDPYYVMPFYTGGGLTRWAGRLTHAQLRRVAFQIAEVVASAHAVDVRLGDLKPDNILLTNTGDLRVADPLGNAGACTIVFGMNSGGTPGYWAPEVAARKTSISKAGDVFSFGATMYHMVTGRIPVDGQNLDPRAVGALIPDDLRNVILACCKIDPRSRPSMREVLVLLAKPTPLKAVAKPAMHPVSAEGGLGALGVLAVFVGLALLANGK